IDIIARDNGSPSLSASATLTVFVDHIATPSPDPGLGFADSKYTVEIDENTPSSTIVKTLPIMNKPRSHFTFTCEIISGNDEDKFSIVENSNQDCEIRIKEPLDYEHQSRYMLTLRLNSIAGLAGFSRLMTQIVINVMDVNDNKPVFHVPGRYSHLTRDRYIAAISSDAPADSQVAQLKATDSDSIANGIITYSLIPSSDPQGRFKIEPGSGILRTSRPMEDIPPSQLPLRLEVIVRDNPQLQSSSLSESSEVIVNLIEDKHRLIFVLRDTSTGRAQESKEQFLQIIQDRTGLITGWEKAESLKIQRNHTIESDVTGTDIWIHLIDPSTLKILPTDDPKIESILSDVKIKYSLIQALTSGLGLASSTLTVRSPYVPIIVSTAAVVPIPMNSDINNLGLGLIVLAAAIAVCGCAGIVYQCGSSSKSSSAPTTGSTISKPGGGKVKRVMMSPAPPRLYDPIYTAETVTSSSILANNGKQYETQVLHMDMKIDDEMGGRGIERGGYNGHHLSSSTHSSSSSSSTPLESDKTSLRGLISVRDLMSNVSYMPRSRAYNNHSPSTVTSTVNDKSSSSRSTSRPESSGSSSSNEGLKSNLKTPLYYKLLDDNRSPMFTDGRTLLTRDGKTTEL
ncbi:cadherin-99C-like, partial [Panonychus citri]